jgi:hypothetical protein
MPVEEKILRRFYWQKKSRLENLFKIREEN